MNKKNRLERPPLLAESLSKHSTPKRKRSASPVRPALLADISSPKDEKISSRIVATIGRFLSNTTSHGLPRIPKARNFYGSIFWLFVWMVAAAVTIITAMLLYHRYSTQVPATAVTVGF